MSLVSTCPFCGKQYEVDDSLLGQVITCDRCNRAFVIQARPHTGNNDDHLQGGQEPPPPFDKKVDDIRHSAEETIRKTFKLNKLEGFSFTRFMRQVFKHHPWDEVEEYMAIGTPHNTPPLSEVQPIWPAPWLFFRTMLFTVLLYLFLIWRADFFGKVYILLPLWITGVIGIPFATLLFFWEVNIPKNISMLSLLRIVVISGFASIALALVFFKLIGDLESAVWAGPIEETAKALVILLFIRNPKRRFKLNGLLIGAAVGAGFAVIESGGYMLRNGPDGTMELRALCAPFGHVAYSAIVGFALWRAKGLGGSFGSRLLSSAFLPLFLLSVGIHMFWNSEILSGELLIRTAIVGAVEYGIIIYLIQEGINEVRMIKAENDNGIPAGNR